MLENFTVIIKDIMIKIKTMTIEYMKLFHDN